MTSFLFLGCFYIIADNFPAFFSQSTDVFILYVKVLYSISLLYSECDTCGHRTFIVQPSHDHRTAIAHETVCDASANVMHWVRNAIVREELEKLLLHYLEVGQSVNCIEVERFKRFFIGGWQHEWIVPCQIFGSGNKEILAFLLDCTIHFLLKDSFVYVAGKKRYRINFFRIP